MSILPHDALAVDVYGDESPELPISTYFEPTPHDAASCACDVCFRDRRERLDAEVAVLLEADGSDPEAWPAWTDLHVWEPTEDPRPLADRVATVATSLKRLDTILGDFLADEMFSLAHNIRRVQATTPMEFEARMEIIDRDILNEAEERGWDNGYAAGLAASF